MTKTYAITDILTPEEIKRAVDMYKKAPIGTFARQLDREIITPNLARIEAKLGQRMSARYVAYSVEYALSLVDKIEKAMDRL